MQILPGDKNYNYVMDRLKKTRAGEKVGAYNPPYDRYGKKNPNTSLTAPTPTVPKTGTALGSIIKVFLKKPAPKTVTTLGGIISPVFKKPIPQEKTETIYSNPLQITTEYAPFSPLLSEVAPVIIPENPQDDQKSKLSTSGIIGVGLALAAGLL